MERDSKSNEVLNEMVDAAIKEGRHDHFELARKAFPKIKPKRRRELSISRLSQQLCAKFRRKFKQPVIPGLLKDENEQAAS